MSLWRWWSRPRPPTSAPVQNDATESREPDVDRTPRPSDAPLDPMRDSELAALHEGDAAVRCAALGRLAGTTRERDALAELARAKAAGTVPDALLVAGADLHVQRGESTAALELLDDVGTPAGLLLAADVHAERGDMARALTLVERVLARDIDVPGARERHARLCRELGGPLAVPALQADATVLRADVPASALRITGEAGRGGAGTVYEAEDAVLGRRVALKVYHRPAEEQDKLVSEARIAVELAGRGVIRVFDADPVQGILIMEWLGGGALKGWLTRPQLSALGTYTRWYPELVSIVAGVHRRGWVHADLKPANILFAEELVPVVSDFGLAQRPGQVLVGGSLGYLSPERIAGRPLEQSDDVFALGRILEDVLDCLREHGGAEEPPAWRRVARRATAELADRPPDAVHLLDHLPGSSRG